MRFMTVSSYSEHFKDLTYLDIFGELEIFNKLNFFFNSMSPEWET